MRPSVVLWSNEKQNQLHNQLVGYWADDIWDMRNPPLPTIQNSPNGVRFLKFSCLSPTVKVELKYVSQQKILKKEWRFGESIAGRLSLLQKCINHVCGSQLFSILEKDVNEWVLICRTYLAEQGYSIRTQKTALRSNQKEHTYPGDHECIYLLRQIHLALQGVYDTRSEYDKDIWDVRRFGKTIPAAHSSHKLNFTSIPQDWLRTAIKHYLAYRISIYSVGGCQGQLVALNDFARFLAQRYPTIQPFQINRQVVVDYLTFLTSQKLTPYKRRDRLSTLRLFLEKSAYENWAALTKERILHDEDLPDCPRRAPRFIPESILNQLFNHLDTLKPPYPNMVRVLYGTGMRISELLALPCDCLTQDQEGDWWIRYIRRKTHEETLQPISAETAAAIQLQQKTIIQALPESRLLFPNSKGKPIQYTHFVEILNRLAVAKQIQDSTGTTHRFRCHDFRHTYGTELVNRGVPLHVIQRLLGHKTPEMSSVYAHIHDSTLKQEFAKALQERKLVDISGRVITENSVADAGELQWLKKHTDARTLPNGYCGIPVALGPCIHPNACLTCPHFRTDQSHIAAHEKQMEETLKLIQIARVKGYTVQIENNERIAHNLKTIITRLKEDADDSQTEC